MKGLVSVIVPVYNVNQYIRRCVDSIINQSYKELEIILVDDGSTDDSGLICDDYAKTDNRITVIHKCNGGLSDARNAGIEKCRGDYITFVDSDDYINHEMIARLYSLCEKCEADIAVGNYIYAEEKDIDSYKSDKEANIDIYTGTDIVDNMDHICTMSCGKLYRKKIFESIRYPKGKYHEDEYVIHRILYESSKIVYTSEYLYYYVKRSGSIMMSKTDKNIYDLIEAYKDRYEFYKSVGDINHYRQHLEHYVFSIRLSECCCDDIMIYNPKEYSANLRLHIWSKLPEIRKQKILSVKEYIRTLIWCISPKPEHILRKLRGKNE